MSNDYLILLESELVNPSIKLQKTIMWQICVVFLITLGISLGLHDKDLTCHFYKYRLSSHYSVHVVSPRVRTRIAL